MYIMRTYADHKTVYELSLHVSIIFLSSLHTTASLAYLFPKLYIKSNFTAVPQGSITTDVQTSPASARDRGDDPTVTALLSLLHQLVHSFPKQSAFLAQLRSTPSSCFPQGSPAREWVVRLARSLRTRNFTQFAALTRQDAYEPIIHHPSVENHSTGCPRALLPRLAFNTLLSSLSSKSREQTWSVLRSAYKEFGCNRMSDTELWLDTALGLQERAMNGVPSDLSASRVRVWLQERERAGEVEQKRGLHDRWMVVKQRS